MKLRSQGLHLRHRSIFPRCSLLVDSFFCFSPNERVSPLNLPPSLIQQAQTGRDFERSPSLSKICKAVYLGCVLLCPPLLHPVHPGNSHYSNLSDLAQPCPCSGKEDFVIFGALFLACMPFLSFSFSLSSSVAIGCLLLLHGATCFDNCIHFTCQQHLHHRFFEAEP